MEREIITKPVTFNDLSAPLKTLVVISWVTSSLLILSFIVGFIAGLLGA